MPLPGTTAAPPSTLSLTFRMTIGTHEKHEIEVSYGRALRLLRVRVDGRTLYRRCGLLAWGPPRATEFKTPGREVHTFIVEPPGVPANQATDPNSYWVWLDGRPVLRVERR